MKKHWEYSQECFDVIAEYQERFPEFIDALAKTLKLHKQIVSLEDLFGKKADEAVLVPRIRELCRFIETCPLSNLPYVEIGFDTVNVELMQKLESKRADIKEKH